MGISFIKFGPIKKQAAFGENIIPDFGKIPLRPLLFRLMRTIPCERKTIKWASKLPKKIKAMEKRDD